MISLTCSAPFPFNLLSNLASPGKTKGKCVGVSIFRSFNECIIFQYSSDPGGSKAITVDFNRLGEKYLDCLASKDSGINPIIFKYFFCSGVNFFNFSAKPGNSFLLLLSAPYSPPFPLNITGILFSTIIKGASSFTVGRIGSKGIVGISGIFLVVIIVFFYLPYYLWQFSDIQSYFTQFFFKTEFIERIHG